MTATQISEKLPGHRLDRWSGGGVGLLHIFPPGWHLWQIPSSNLLDAATSQRPRRLLLPRRPPGGGAPFPVYLSSLLGIISVHYDPGHHYYTTHVPGLPHAHQSFLLLPYFYCLQRSSSKGSHQHNCSISIVVGCDSPATRCGPAAKF